MDDPGQDDQTRADAYWKANLKLLAVLLTIWFAGSFGAGILFRPFLDQWMIGGYPLGFWFAQQGSIYLFVALIFVYVFAMRRLDRRFGVED
jgi:putative solute:sodium symporter small subunit